MRADAAWTVNRRCEGWCAARSRSPEWAGGGKPVCLRSVPRLLGESEGWETWMMGGDWGFAGLGFGCWCCVIFLLAILYFLVLLVLDLGVGDMYLALDI